MLFELQSWLQTAAENQPVKAITPENEDVDLKIYSDASSWGAGAVAIDREGHTEQFTEPWSSAERDRYRVESSVTSEPLAAVKAACRFVRPHHRHVVLCSDHIGLVYAAEAGYGRALQYNIALQRLADLFPQTRISVRFVAGTGNQADTLSRGLASACAVPSGAPPIVPSVRVG